MGIPIVGNKFSKNNKEELNKKGYWELNPKAFEKPFGDKYLGKGIKMFGGELEKTDPKHIQKVIYTDRAIGHAAKSMMKYLKANPDLHVSPTRKNAEDVIYLAGFKAREYLKKHNIEYLRINYKDMIDNTEQMMLEIEDYLGLKLTDNQLISAISNVEREVWHLRQ